MARNSFKAEYKEMTLTLCELLWWLRQLLSDLGIKHIAPTTLYCHNQVALAILANPVYHERVKYVDIECDFIRDQVNSNVISLSSALCMG